MSKQHKCDSKQEYVKYSLVNTAVQNGPVLEHISAPLHTYSMTKSVVSMNSLHLPLV